MEDFFYKCPICGNTDTKYIGHKNGKPYCRRCIEFKGAGLESRESYPKNAPIIINYSLSTEQLDLSNALLKNYQTGINSLVNAVCGSGKTEIVLQVISNAIKCGEKVAFAIPRRDVAIELYDRFKTIFKFNKIVCVYGGHHKQLEGDLIILTTHQLYRYVNYFDLLILDEIDAFPFANNETLNAMFFRAIKGHYIMLSATPSEQTIEYFEQQGHQILSLNKRFHNYLLPVPQLIIKKQIFLYYALYKQLSSFLNETKQVFIFTPTIEICENTYHFLNVFLKGGNAVHSKCLNREEIIADFKRQKYAYLVTTAVLERGVTVKDLQVIVFLANHAVYTSAALVQISGRAGRKKDAPTGKVVYIANDITKEMEESIRQIEKANSDL